MGKGRYLKAAERACARKSRFETAASAEAFVERRYRAYRCVVCGGWHLTSGHGAGVAEEPRKKEPKGPTLGDLDWSAVLEPKVPRTSAPVLSPPDSLSGSIEDNARDPRRREEERPCTARCVGGCGKDGRVLLVVQGRLVKSRPVERGLRGSLGEGVEVRVEGEPPRVLGIV